MADNYSNMSCIRFCSHNCRDFNTFKQPYLRSLLDKCDLFLKKQWLSVSQIPSLNSLSADHMVIVVCGFNTSVVMNVYILSVVLYILFSYLITKS